MKTTATKTPKHTTAGRCILRSVRIDTPLWERACALVRERRGLTKVRIQSEVIDEALRCYVGIGKLAEDWVLLARIQEAKARVDHLTGADRICAFHEDKEAV